MVMGVAASFNSLSFHFLLVRMVQMMMLLHRMVATMVHHAHSDSVERREWNCLTLPLLLQQQQQQQQQPHSMVIDSMIVEKVNEVVVHVLH